MFGVSENNWENNFPYSCGRCNVDRDCFSASRLEIEWAIAFESSKEEAELSVNFLAWVPLRPIFRTLRIRPNNHETAHLETSNKEPSAKSSATDSHSLSRRAALRNTCAYNRLLPVVAKRLHAAMKTRILRESDELPNDTNFRGHHELEGTSPSGFAVTKNHTPPK